MVRKPDDLLDSVVGTFGISIRFHLVEPSGKPSHLKVRFLVAQWASTSASEVESIVCLLRSICPMTDFMSGSEYEETNEKRAS